MHVAVPSREAAIQVSNRLRPQLPLLLGLTANSAIYRGADSGYASWRQVLWSRWPSAGPPPYFDSEDDYDGRSAADAGHRRDARRRHGLLGCPPVGELSDRRGARRRRARHAAETVLLAALTRGTVMTALDDERRGVPIRRLRPHELAAAQWKSARDGLDGHAVDPFEGRGLVPAIDLLRDLVERISPALRAVGDLEFVESELGRVFEQGNGAMRQRDAWERRGEVSDVIAAAAAATSEGC